MTITEAVRGLTIGDCLTHREAVKTIRKYFENGDPVERIREEIEEQKQERCFDDDDMFVYRTGLDDALYIIDKYREPQAERSGEE